MRLFISIFMIYLGFQLLSANAVEDFSVIDKPNDNGGAIVVSWKEMVAETEKNFFYQIMIAEQEDGPFYPLEKMAYPLKGKGFEVKGYNKEGEESTLVVPNKTYFVKMKVLNGDKSETTVSESEIISVTTKGNFFAFNKLNSFLILIFLTVVIMCFIVYAQRNPHKLFVRRIAGLDAMEDALGRATEMGRSALFVHGLRSVSEIPTIAAINILGKIAKKIAEFDATLRVSNWDPIVQQVSQETVKEAHIEAGRPDTYKSENIFFAAGDQFSYAAAVEGIMVREKPATIFYFGYFYAESLLLSETGAHTGAIQIAGSDAFTQIPFFITTCDYTLIGEELYAASAYLSREPKLLGGLKGQDVGKMAIILILILGTLFTTLGWQGFSKLFWPS
ncbi:MAG: hypothetical protein HQK50_09155 [Oligoflexia bacterium]|nr:hypothetical protein [Oligoflexia bacterium]MBF0365727.1 hypothetical protein [Oligoflexia bacterium]